MFRPSQVVACAVVLMTAACTDAISNVVSSSAIVRVVNDTDTPILVTNSGIMDSLNTTIVFGQASVCMFVDLSHTTVPALTLANAVTGAPIATTLALTVGANITIVAFGDTVGNVRLTALSNRFVPTASDGGLRFFNGALQAGVLLMQRGGVALTQSVAFGAASTLVSVPTDSASITFSNGSSVVLDAGLMAFPLAQNSTVFVAPPASGTVPLRFFTVQGC
jgi:hypothetical protein